MRIPICLARQQRHDQANQERPGDIHGERSERKARADSFAQVAADPEAQHRPDAAANADHYIFHHDVALLSLLYAKSRQQIAAVPDLAYAFSGNLAGDMTPRQSSCQESSSAPAQKGQRLRANSFATSMIILAGRQMSNRRAAKRLFQ